MDGDGERPGVLLLHIGGYGDDLRALHGHQRIDRGILDGDHGIALDPPSAEVVLAAVGAYMEVDMVGEVDELPSRQPAVDAEPVEGLLALDAAFDAEVHINTA